MEPTKIQRGDTVEVKIDSLAFGGEGVARAQNGERPLVVFVEDVVPGDTVEVKIGMKKKNFARGFVKKMVEPSKDRIVAKCIHFGSPVGNRVEGSGENGDGIFIKGCGGCVWQFLDIQNQRKIKEQQVRDAFQRIGGFAEDLVLPILGGEPWFYRNKMEFSFSRRAPNAKAPGELSLGLHLKRKHYDVTELQECFLLEPFIGKLVMFVRAFFQKFDREKGFDPELLLKSFTVRVGKNTGEIMMIVNAENGEENFMNDFKVALQKYCGDEKIALDSLYFLHLSNIKGQRNSLKETLLFGKKTIQETLRLPDGTTLQFEISPQAFFQPNTAMAQVLYAKALEAAELSGKETVFDLYCGTGTIGLFCASKAAKVYGVELNASAILNAKANAELNKITNAEFLVGDVQQILPEFKNREGSKNPDVVLVDPPRNGLSPKVVETVAEFGPKRIVYVSCNPTSLARDAALFRELGYKLISVQPVDQFPQTYHIENVAVFVK